MSRPKPKVIAEHVNNITHMSDQILEANGIYAVFYDNKPFNSRTQNIFVSEPGPKYRKLAFSNPGHAINLTKKLNAKFKTDKFTVVLLTQGVQHYP